MINWFPPAKDPISADGSEFVVEWSQRERPVLVTGTIEAVLRDGELTPAHRPEEEA